MKKTVGFTAAAFMTILVIVGSFAGAEQIAGDDDYGNMFTYTAPDIQVF